MRMVGFVNVLVQAIVFQWGSRERKENEYRGLDSGQALVLYLGQMLN